MFQKLQFIHKASGADQKQQNSQKGDIIRHHIAWIKILFVIWPRYISPICTEAPHGRIGMMASAEL